MRFCNRNTSDAIQTGSKLFRMGEFEAGWSRRTETTRAAKKHDGRDGQRSQGRGLGNGRQCDVGDAVGGRDRVCATANGAEVHQRTHEITTGRQHDAAVHMKRVGPRIASDGITHVAASKDGNVCRTVHHPKPNRACADAAIELVSPLGIDREQRDLGDMEIDAVVRTTKGQPITTFARKVSINAEVARGQIPIEVISSGGKGIVKWNRACLHHRVLKLIDELKGKPERIAASNPQRPVIDENAGAEPRGLPNHRQHRNGQIAYETWPQRHPHRSEGRPKASGNILPDGTANFNVSRVALRIC